MTNVTSNPRRRGAPRTLFFAACGLFILCMPGVAAARPYTVVSCDSAGLFGYSSAAWTPFGNAGSAYEACPTGGGSTAGVSNRLIGMTYAGFSHSGHVFAAPPGTTITQVRWSGRAARNNCHWGAYLRALPSGAPMFGLPVGQYCDATGFDTRGWPMPFAAPEGTTRVDQLVICGAAQCQPGATIHAHVMEVTVDDPIPPSIALDGPLASGEWVSGRAGEADTSVDREDNAGIVSVSGRDRVGERTRRAFPATGRRVGHARLWSRAYCIPDHRRPT